MRVAVLIDGSNLIAELYRCSLGYPALAPLISALRGPDELVFARFYGTPPLDSRYRPKWMAFQDANRHIMGLDWFQGYRNTVGTEKGVDVALAVDLIYGCANGHFDRAVIVGGDGDHVYAFKIARSMRCDLRVHLMPSQVSSNLAQAHIPFTYWSVADLVNAGICDRGPGSGVPLLHRAPSGSPNLTPRLIGASARQVL